MKRPVQINLPISLISRIPKSATFVIQTFDKYGITDPFEWTADILCALLSASMWMMRRKVNMNLFKQFVPIYTKQKKTEWEYYVM